MKWSDLLRVKSEFPINSGPTRCRPTTAGFTPPSGTNLPYDRFARQLLVSSGSNFRVPEVNFLPRRPKAKTRKPSRKPSPSPSWERAPASTEWRSSLPYRLQVHRRWKEEIVFFDTQKGAGALRALQRRFPDGAPARLAPGQDPRVYSPTGSWRLANPLVRA